jgi:glycosyltransferase involved in cell wall biosynthesis
MKKIIIAIDATSIVNTGGFTHLYHLIESFDKKFHPDINKIIIYSSKTVLDRLPDNEFIAKISSFFLNRGKLFRLFFQLFILDFFLKKNKANVLLSTTGDYTGNFRPYVGISQNMLLYEKDFWKEIGSLKEKSKLLINYNRQKKCFKAASGIIFISNYAEDYITNELKIGEIPSKVIHHGISSLFINEKPKKLQQKQNVESTLKFIYVSTVHVYKNQWNVIDAIWKLRQNGIKVSLTLIGPIIYAPSGEKLYSKMREKDPKKEFIKYIPQVPHEKLPSYYSNHDAIIYASTCENMPNILIESMASGLPIACSDKEPMPEFLKQGGYYFNADSVDSIIHAITNLIEDNDSLKKIKQNLNEVKKLKWEETSKKTFNFITNLIK